MRLKYLRCGITSISSECYHGTLLIDFDQYDPDVDFLYCIIITYKCVSDPSLISYVKKTRRIKLKGEYFNIKSRFVPGD